MHNSIQTGAFFQKNYVDPESTTGTIFNNLILNNLTFINCNFTKCRFYGVTFTNCVFTKCNFTDAIFEDVSIENSDLVNSDFSKATMQDVKFINCNKLQLKFDDINILDNVIGFIDEKDSKLIMDAIQKRDQELFDILKSKFTLRQSDPDEFVFGSEDDILFYIAEDEDCIRIGCEIQNEPYKSFNVMYDNVSMNNVLYEFKSLIDYVEKSIPGDFGTEAEELLIRYKSNKRRVKRYSFSRLQISRFGK